MASENNHYYNMNMFARAIAIPYLSARDGQRCNICKTSLKELDKEAKIKEEQSGKKRIMPYLIVDRIDNSGIHTIDIHNAELMAKYQLVCYPCNRKKNKHRARTTTTLTQATGRAPTREKLDSLRFQPAFHKNLKTFLLDNQHGCFIDLIKNSKTFSGGCSQEAGKRYFGDEEITTVNKKGLYQKFPFKCESENCNGVHVCLTGTEPTKLLDQENIKLEGTWWVEYGNKREEYRNNSAYFTTPFMELDEYKQTHCELLAHNFK